MQIRHYTSFEEAKADWQTLENSIFHYPFQSWWYNNLFTQHFSDEKDIHILGVFDNPSTSLRENCLAIGAFEVVGQTVKFLGTKDVSKTSGLVQDITDFGDLLYSEDGKTKASEIWEQIKNHFKNEGLQTVQLDYVREDSPTYSVLKTQTTPQQDETSPFIVLPTSWDEYLTTLEKKQRHELKRKINRLEKETAFHLCKDQTIAVDFQNFIRLHKLSDPNKAKFMTKEMEKFFWDMVTCEKEDYQIHFCSLFIDNKQVAFVMAFMNDTQTLLYNSGFDPEYGYYSVGLLVKAFLLKKSIEQGKKIYDFLRGNERYKYDLGAKDLPLFKMVLS